MIASLVMFIPVLGLVLFANDPVDVILPTGVVTLTGAVGDPILSLNDNLGSLRKALYLNHLALLQPRLDNYLFRLSVVDDVHRRGYRPGLKTAVAGTTVAFLIISI